jgi:hypothetical protein
MDIFSPYRQKMDILSKYPDQAGCEANIELRATNRSDGLVEWPPGKDAGTVSERKVCGKACRRTDRGSPEGAGVFAFRLTNPRDWQGKHDVRLKIEYLDRGRGSIVGSYDTWMYPGIFTEDLLLTDSGEWKEHTFLLRDVAFRDLGSQGVNLCLIPLRGEDIYLRSVRLQEISKPPEAYEEVVRLYQRKIRKWKGTWAAGHYLYHMILVLREGLGKEEETKSLVGQLIDKYPNSECIETLQHRIASFIRMYG